MTSSTYDFSTRLDASEQMDDFSITDDRLTRALEQLRLVNRLLGGHASSDTALDPLLRHRPHLRVLDLACGGGGFLRHLVQRGAHFGCKVSVVGLDANPVTVGHARAYLDRTLPPALRVQARVDVGDALAPSYPDAAFDVVHCSLFLHHLYGADAVQLLRDMQRMSRDGLVVNDLHRHRLAYLGFWLFSRLFRMSPMVRHDGLISVRRGFRRTELRELAHEAGISSPSIRWHWAFRWTLSTLPDVE